ncbi:MAG: aromatic amino acid lyase, partial [Thermoplasmataceae archaeon]
MISIDGQTLTIEQIYLVSEKHEKVSVSEEAKNRIIASRNSLTSIVESGANIYGVNTGFGSLLNVKIPFEKIEVLQKNLIRSHSAGVGEPLSEKHVRAIMLVRANSLCKGYSGVSLELIEKIVEFLNKDVYPYVPRYGSVGASGDLAPLAHIGLS